MVEVKYNDAVIASLEAGQTATLQCIGKKMLGNVVVTAPETVENPLPLEITTDAEMNALLATAEVGAIYKYTGTTGIYENGALYIVELPLISFTIAGTQYQAEEGMTWGEWYTSDYNTSTYYIAELESGYPSGYYIQDISPTDIIIEGYAYTVSYGSHGGGSND